MRGLTAFVALTFGVSWAVAALVWSLGWSTEQKPIITRLLTTSLLYALTMGWQPLLATWFVRRYVDPRDHLDLALRPAAASFRLLGAAGSIVLAGSAMTLAWLAQTHGSLHGSAEPELSAQSASLGGALALAAAFFATLLVVWLQAFAEEVGWRGYFLPRLMERFGRWGGLVAHGIVWGVWYTPVVAVWGSAARGGGFVITCMLLGVLFAWLRLASSSVVPVVIANTTLTLAAGLPYVLHDIDAGLRGAVFGPPGWVLMAITIAVLMQSRFRGVIRVPPRLAPESLRGETLH